MNKIHCAALASLLASTLVACGGDDSAGTQSTSGGTSSGGTAGTSQTSGGGGQQATGGNNGSGGDSTGTSGSNVANDSGAAGTAVASDAAGLPDVMRMPKTCSDAVLRTGPPAGKEALKADPIDTKFPFSSHWIGEWGTDEEAKQMGQTSMADFDNDGNLDFAAGKRQPTTGAMYWWEYCSPDHWVRHHVGAGHSSAASGSPMDVDGDGWVDIVAGNSWYKNPKTPRTTEWPRFATGTPAAEELIVGDITGDGKHEVLYVLNTINPQWWAPGPNPEQNWIKGAELSHQVNQGAAWGDIDGDGKNDYWIGNQWWFKNVNGDGKTWTETTVAAGASFDPAPLTYIGDLDGDGDNDVAMQTHWGGTNGMSMMSWMENLNKVGTQWAAHSLTTNLHWSHGVIIADFDNDKDLDILFAQNVGPSYIYENTGNANADMRFVQHKITNDFRGHTPRAEDVDCDGDLDIAGGPWGDHNQANSGENVANPPVRDYMYLQNMTVERGGTPIPSAQRAKNERGAIVQARTCP